MMNVGWFARAQGPFAYGASAPDVPGEISWRRARLLSPVAEPGAVVLRSRGGRIQELRSQELARPGDLFAHVDVRRRLLALAPQTIPVRDGVEITATAVIAVRTTDVVRCVLSAANPDTEVYLAVQIALRDLVAASELDRVLLRDIDMAPVLGAARAAAAEVGLSVDDVVLKDVSAPRLLAQAREEAAVVDLRARTELERARGEVKATRARLAASQMLERSPVLARLRLIEAMPPGSRLNLGDAGLGALPAAAESEED